jgi:hypothetical protein
MAALPLAVGTVICPIRVLVPSGLIIAVIVAAAATEMQSNVGGGYEILENSIGGGEMASERTGIISAQCSDCS